MIYVENPWKVKEKISLTLKSDILYESSTFTHGVILPKNLSFFFSFLPKFLPLYPNFLKTCSSYNMRNVVRYIETGVELSLLPPNPNMAIVLCHGWRIEKIRKC